MVYMLSVCCDETFYVAICLFVSELNLINTKLKRSFGMHHLFQGALIQISGLKGAVLLGPLGYRAAYLVEFIFGENYCFV